MTRSGK